LAPDSDHSLQGYAAASLDGLDARLVAQIPVEASAIRFDPSGKSLYLSGAKGRNWIWNYSTHAVHETGIKRAGLFAFKRGETAVQLLRPMEGNPRAIELWSVQPPARLCTYVSPIGRDSTIESITITPDASRVAATIFSKEKSHSAV